MQLDACTVAVLVGVFVGWALRGGTPAARLARALGKDQAAKLVRLLELLEEPEREQLEDDEAGAG